MTDIIWKDIPNCPGYQANAEGEIRSLSRKVKCRGGLRTIRGCVLRPFIAKSTGYVQVAIFRRKHNVHSLIAATWCDGRFDGSVVDHVNGNRLDNRACNLEWVTMSENTRRSYALGRVGPYLGKFSAEHPTSKAVIAIDLITGAELRFDAGLDAVRQGFDSAGISRCCNGLSRSHKGFAWRFAEQESEAA